MSNSPIVLFALTTASLLMVDVEAATPLEALNRVKIAVPGSVQLRILHLPYSLATRVNVTPQEMEGYVPVFRRIISRKDHAQIFAGLQAALSETYVRDCSQLPDVRWGCVLYSADGRRIGSFYLEKKYINRADVTGVLNDTTIICNTAL